MANLYWYGGSGNWSDYTNHWSNNSGNSPASPASAAPTATDNAIFDANSGVGTVTIDVAATCLDFNQDALSTITTFAGTFTLAISGSLIISVLTTFSYSGAITFNSISSGKTITTTGTIFNGNFVFNGSGGGWTLQDDLNIGTKTFDFEQGTVNTNGVTVTCGSIGFYGAYSYNRTLTLGSSTINAYSVAFSANHNNSTINADTSTINVTNGGDLGDFTYNNFTYIGAVSKTLTLSTSGNSTISGTFTITGNSVTNRILVNSDTLGTPRTITAAVVSLTNVDFQDIVGAGAGTWSGTSVGNALGNSGITFTTPVTRYWVDVDGGSWSATTSWSASSGGASGETVPLCHDTVVFDVNSITSGSRTITADMPRLGAGINFTGIANTPTLNFSVVTRVFGSLTLGTMNISGTGALYFEGRSSLTLTSAGITFTNPIYVFMFGGTLTLQDNLVITNASTGISHSDGIIDANGNDVTITTYQGNGSSRTHTLNMGSGTWTLTGIGTIWNDFDGLTINAQTSTIIISDTSSTAKTFWASTTVKTYNNLTVTGDNVTINRRCIFNTITLNNAGLTNGFKFPAGVTLDVSNFVTNGTSGNLIYIQSSSAGSPATLSKSSGSVIASFCSIKDSAATGGARWYATSTCTMVSGNTGWLQRSDISPFPSHQP